MAQTLKIVKTKKKMDIKKIEIAVHRIILLNGYTATKKEEPELGTVIGFGFTINDFGGEYPELFLLDCELDEQHARDILTEFVKKRFTEICYILKIDKEEITELKEEIAWEIVVLSLTRWRKKWNQNKITK